jgi:hypothetical protein
MKRKKVLLLCEMLVDIIAIATAEAFRLDIAELKLQNILRRRRNLKKCIEVLNGALTRYVNTWRLLNTLPTSSFAATGIAIG